MAIGRLKLALENRPNKAEGAGLALSLAKVLERRHRPQGDVPTLKTGETL
jgi:hypothetical protein